MSVLLSAPPPLAPELAVQNRGRTAAAASAPPRPTDSPRLLMDLMDLRPPGGAPPGAPIAAVCRNALIDALRHRDHRTLTHSHRAAWLAGGVARGLGVGGAALAVVETAALLHDVGKIGVPDNILYKPGPLCTDEAELMDLHRGICSTVLQACGASDDLLAVIARVGAEDDPDDDARSEVHDLPGRIVSLCEAYDSLRTAQPYRDGYPHEAALKALSGRTSHRYDPTILDNLDRWVRTQGEASALDELLAPAQGAGTGSDPASALRAVRFCHIFGYLSLLETLYEGFCLLDADLRCTVWSPGLEGLLGHRASDLRGEIRTAGTLEFADADGNPLSDGDRPLDRMLSTGRPLAETVKVRRGAGANGRPGAGANADEWVDVEVQVFHLTDSDGGVRGVAEIYRNLNRPLSRPREYKELRRAATRDPLTGVANRGELESRLARALRESREEGRPLAVMFLDLDHFKSINDTWGHGVGDEVLKHLTTLLKAECYSGETVGRYGGEEFVVVCPQTDLAAAAKRADRLRRVIAETKVNGRSQPRPTASFGVAAAEPGDTVESLVQRADAALYLSKDTGRNKVTALTEAQRRDGADPAAAERRDRVADFRGAAAGGGFRLEQTVQACLAASMVTHKMRGFLEDHAARAISVTDSEIRFKLGHAGLTGRWGRRRDDCPVEVRVKVGAELMKTRSAAGLNDVTLVITPLGWGVKRAVWEERSGQVARDLRAYLAAGQSDVGQWK
ncbi:diguanylate cyclase [Alienimonas californiensis]|uniref:diguanylate cyclase n=1 Tax=Alienimonas californiensis TaxID=2527989 RepID=A0A517P7S5_9PLAN|nr:diguanylate cyclase [Alienimonas californiensis]QDT15429.1 Response regulator PleD [Alienimonas californiensis]